MIILIYLINKIEDKLKRFFTVQNSACIVHVQSSRKNSFVIYILI